MIETSIESSKQALTVACFYVLTDLEIEARLRIELKARISNSEQMSHFRELKSLKYLKAVTNEGELCISPPSCLLLLKSTLSNSRLLKLSDSS